MIEILTTAIALAGFTVAFALGVRLARHRPNPILTYGIMVAGANMIFRAWSLAGRVFGFPLGRPGVAAALALQVGLAAFMVLVFAYAWRARQ